MRRALHNRGCTLCGSVLWAAAALVFGGCAQQGYPSGGPKDVAPPVVQECAPPNGSAHFVGNTFVVKFDEFVQTKEMDNNVITSPPLKHKVEYTTRGGELHVKIKDTLPPATTYSFLFRGAIIDYHEGNALPSFEYFFSTGEALDSMVVCGRVVDAFTGQPRKEAVSVMLYAAADSVAPASLGGDSVVAKGLPDYITMCGKDGNFLFPHLRAGRYRVVAIEDADRNKRLNGDEPAAFADTLVTAGCRSAANPSAQRIDTLLLPMSDNPHKVQRVAKSGCPRPGYAEIVAELPLSPEWSLSRLAEPDSKRPAFEPVARICRSRDTLRVWMPEGDDTTRLHLVDATGLDDTLLLCYRDKKAAPPTKGRPASPEPRPVQFFKTMPASHPYWDTLWINFENPVVRVGGQPADSARVLRLKDSTTLSCSLMADSNRLRAALLFASAPGTKYQITLPAGLCEDIYGRPSPELSAAVEYAKTEAYGGLILHLNSLPASCPLIVELTNEKDEAVQQHFLAADTAALLRFPHLQPGKYGFRLIEDRNGDRQWTPGDYWLHRQPERVRRFGKTLDLHANWDMEETWKL